MSSKKKQTWSTDDWDLLLDDIHDGKVIPVIGNELITAPDGFKLLYSVVSELLAKRLNLSPNGNSSETLTPHHVLCAYLERCDELDRDAEPEHVYSRMCDVFEALNPDPPRPLLDLAAITHLNLFITTLPDQLMENALDQVRFNTRKGTSSIAFTLTKPREDLKREYERRSYKVEDPPTVFHLFGGLSRNVDRFIISDGDMLEFFSALQSVSDDEMSNLVYAVRENHLLFLGSSFSDWLARFFLRATKRLRLSEKKLYDVVVANRWSCDPDLQSFLQFFTQKTKVYVPPAAEGASPGPSQTVEFVSELLRRWRERFPDAATAKLDILPRIDPPDKMPPGAIFISYASEDRDAVRVLKAHLESHGLTVWFDRDQLQAGHDWEIEIEENVDKCRFFVPVISATTQRRETGFFRREWRYADRRSEEQYRKYEFIFPVMLDDPSNLGPLKIEPSFTRKQYSLALGGAPPREMIDRLVELNAQRQMS